MARIFEYVKIALMNIRGNKGRSFLTMLGIIIGISSVILIVSAGNGFKVGISGQLDELVGGYVQFYADVPSDEADSIWFTNDDLDMIYEKVPHVKGATDVWSFGSQASAQSTKGTFSVAPMYGNESLQYYDNAPILKGRYFNKNEAQSAAKVCVINERGAKKLFGSTDVIGLEVNMSMWGITEDYTIVGIRKDNESIAKQMTFGTNADVSMEIPLTLLESLYGYYTDEFSSFIVFADSSEYVTDISKQVKSLLEARYNVRGKDYIQAYDMASEVGMIGDILNYVTIFIMLVAGIALIVGGIGVMNIMLVSVTERTKEIGIRKALGAKTGSILFQFLMEAVIITLIGGFVGIVLGILGARGICGIAASLGMSGMEAVIDPKVVLAATGFSSLIGIFFGIYPARKAAKLSPIEALRHE
ncbi:MAG: ABC transporter permease [Lachnospiraceae bacterium]|nr:ABC transporter permease [Lachnospiraceae bacterium]